MRSIRSIFGLNCEDAAGYCNKAEYQEATFSDKLKLKIHLIFCKPCKEYNHKNHKLTQLLKKADLKSCSNSEKERYKHYTEANSETLK